MIKKLLLSVLVCVALISGANAQRVDQKKVRPLKSDKADETIKSQVMQSKPQYGFIENKGQILDQDGRPNTTVKYLLPLPGNNVVLRTTGFSYDTYASQHQKQQRNKRSDSTSLEQNIQYKRHRIDIEFVDANPNPVIISKELFGDFINFYTGINKNVTANHYRKIVYKDVYPNIDVEFVASPGAEKPVEYNFIVHPGGNARVINLRYRGADKAEIKNNGVELALSYATLRETIPQSFFKESRKNIAVRYKIKSIRGKNDLLVGFEGFPEKSVETLVIDPAPQIIWGTYYGGGSGSYVEMAIDITVDKDQNVLISGFTESPGIMASAGAHQVTYAGAVDAFVAKFSPAGSRIWGTYLGGTAGDTGDAVKTDSLNNVYVSGTTHSTGLATAGAHQTALGGASDAFIAKFTSAGVLVWFTYYGNAEAPSELGQSVLAMDVGLTGNIYVNGRSLGAYSAAMATIPGTSGESFLVKFNSAGVRQWGRYYQGQSEIRYGGLAIDSLENIYCSGRVRSSDVFTATGGAYQPVFGGGSNDSFITKFDSNGATLWATYFGGIGYEHTERVATDNDYVYITGYTESPNLSSPGSHQPIYSSSADAFIAKFSAAGQREWCTYYGGNGQDWPHGIDVSDEYIYVSGHTSSPTNISTDGTVGTPSNTNGFLTKFYKNGTRKWGTYFTTYAYPEALSVDNAENIYITGRITYVSGFTPPISTPGAHQPTYGGGLTDPFLIKFNEPCIPEQITALTINPLSTACAVKFNLDYPAGCTATYSWDFGDGNTSALRAPFHPYATIGTYDVSVTISYNCGINCIGEITLETEVSFTSEPLELEDLVLESQTIAQSQVITSSVSTFSESWLLEHEAAALANRNSFLNGTEGVWRNNATYSFDAQRLASPTPNIQTDGTYTLNSFDWQNAEYDLIPNWIKVNTMTQYSPYSYELENRDVLGVYSAALYDYGGHLPSANGNNMRNKEMGYTSFEHLTGNQTTGNFIFGTPGMQAYYEYEVAPSNKNVVVVKAPVSKLQGVTAVDVVGRKYRSIGSYEFNYGQTYRFQNDPVICVQAHPESPLWSIIVLEHAPQHVWTGTIKVYNEVLPATGPTIDNVVAHSGQSSLKITGGLKTYAQPLLQLDSGKRYIVSCWVAIANSAQALTPVLDVDLGVTVNINRSNGTPVTSIPFTPEGPVIEGWQQVKGVFMSPVNNASIELSFRDGPGTAYYDDLRFHPEKGNMKSYVYDLKDYRLRAILDEENFASFFYYDAEGNLYLTKKETVEGIKTLTENISYQKH